MKSNDSIRISILRWYNLLKQLKKRGHGVRESGALLLAPVGSRRVIEVLYYDDLDPSCLDTGIVKLSGGALIKAWQYCSESGLTIVADAHTHPGASTSQSTSDKDNPIVQKMKGAIIPAG